MENIKNKLHEPTVNKVMIELAKRFGITPMHLISKDRCSYLSDIRHLYCKLRYDCHGLTYAETGRELGRSSTAARYGVMRINDLLYSKNKKIITMWNRVKNIGELYSTPPLHFPTPLRVGGSSKPWDERSSTRANLQTERCEAEKKKTS